MRYRAIVVYDGTGYGGYQRQKNAPSIQAEIERTLTQITGKETRITAAGRTDAGVHAQGQVVAFDAEWQHSIADLLRGTNALLPEQIAFHSLEQAADNFHPRYDAQRRRYRYTVYHAPERDPLVSRYSLHVQRDLDVGAMQAAADALVGEHDFSAFGSPPQGNNPVRFVFEALWTTESPWLYFDIEANAFLYRMVRMLVGTMLRVGYGALTPEVFSEILATQDRQRAGPAASAKGLSLTRVTYAE